MSVLKFKELLSHFSLTAWLSLVPTFGPGESPTTVVSSALSSMEMEDNQPTEDIAAAAVVKESKPTMNLHTLQQLKQEVPALYAPSRLGKALSELFGLLVKLCVGSSMRHRIRPNPQANQTVPPESARKTARSLMELLMKSLQWKPPTLDSLPKFRSVLVAKSSKCSLMKRI